MLKRMILESFEGVVSLSALLMIVVGTLAGMKILSNTADAPLVGLVLGFGGSLLFTSLAFGCIFLQIDINNNLIEIKDTIKYMEQDDVPSGDLPK